MHFVVDLAQFQRRNSPERAHRCVLILQCCLGGVLDDSERARTDSTACTHHRCDGSD